MLVTRIFLFHHFSKASLGVVKNGSFVSMVNMQGILESACLSVCVCISVCLVLLLLFEIL